MEKNYTAPQTRIVHLRPLTPLAGSGLQGINPEGTMLQANPEKIEEGDIGTAASRGGGGLW